MPANFKGILIFVRNIETHIYSIHLSLYLSVYLSIAHTEQNKAATLRCVVVL